MSVAPETRSEARTVGRKWKQCMQYYRREVRVKWSFGTRERRCKAKGSSM